MIHFNVNDRVLVRLTDEGRKVMAEQDAELVERCPSLRGVQLRKEDADGWSEWPLWELMETFGPHTSMAGPLMFETSMRLETSEDRAEASKKALLNWARVQVGRSMPGVRR